MDEQVREIGVSLASRALRFRILDGCEQVLMDSQLHRKKVLPNCRIVLSTPPDAEDHLRRLTARQRVHCLDSVDEQLTHRLRKKPEIKPMRPNSLAPWSQLNRRLEGVL